MGLTLLNARSSFILFCGLTNTQNLNEIHKKHNKKFPFAGMCISQHSRPRPLLSKVALDFFLTEQCFYLRECVRRTLETILHSFSRTLPQIQNNLSPSSSFIQSVTALNEVSMKKSYDKCKSSHNILTGGAQFDLKYDRVL